MFKKTLLAAALAAATFGASAQLTITSTSQDISSQGLPLTKAQNLTSVQVTLSATEAAAVALGSKIKLTFTGAFVSAAPSAPGYVDTAGNLGTGGSFATAIFGTPIATSSTLVSAITQAPALGSAGQAASLTVALTGDTVTFTGIPLLLSSSDVGQKVTVVATLLSSTDVAVASTASASTKVAEIKEQFAAKISTAVGGSADQKIDVANGRKTFESKVKTDTIVIDTTYTGSGANETSATVTLKADYSDDISKANDGTNDYKINAAKTEATFTYTGSTSPTVTAFLTNDVTLTLTVDGEDEIAPRGFTTSVDLAYNDAEGSARTQSLLSDANSGSWSLNGDGAKVSFLPFASDYSQSVTVTNTGKVDGEITVDWFFNGITATTPLTAVAKAGSVTDISAELRAKAAAAGITGNAALNFIVNSPLGDIQIDALYYSKSDKDRGVVLTGGVNNAK